ncbi:hypothetical protein VCHA35O137_30181 [Vibrio chagasii]|nr:hypothetical protein VCHA35P150_20434 [Vibrio chagasii]CAH6905732.1 hypothetical protein VCHA56P515_100043 [Vibrio chagasii]CAH6925774.1 hypothetical protein VCHA35O137_30181 [Vibrio chagasii]CAH6969429.1 hypothetical protein VCHA53O463_110119 [Vibrio chagasii]CAH7075252.1 hypothetical protein VCHA52P454_10710 [Vibrio chagasii]
MKSDEFDLDMVKRFFQGSQKKRDFHWRCGGFAKTVVEDARFAEIMEDLKERLKRSAFDSSYGLQYREEQHRKYQAVLDIEQELRNIGHGYDALIYERDNDDGED